MEKYTVAVEPDTSVKGKRGKFNVVIKKEGSVIGVPLSGVKEAEARVACQAISYAFEYGYEAGKGAVKQFLWDNKLTIVQEQPKDGG